MYTVLNFIDFILTATIPKLDQYTNSLPGTGNAEQTGAPVVPAAPAEPQIDGQKSEQDPNVTPQPSVDDSSTWHEEKVEYRDQDGNLLDEEQVLSLEGKVSFQTRYETRTRIVDAAGNEVGEGSAGAEGFAPPHPDVDRAPETAVDILEDDGREYPATASPEEDVKKEKSVEKADAKTPRPGSEGREATR